MIDTLQFFDLIKTRHNLRSDYELARRLLITPASVSLHRKKPHGMDNLLALRVAKMLDYPAEYVLSCAACERAKCTEEKQVWMRLNACLERHLDELRQGSQ